MVMTSAQETARNALRQVSSHGAIPLPFGAIANLSAHFYNHPSVVHGDSHSAAMTLVGRRSRLVAVRFHVVAREEMHTSAPLHQGCDRE